MVSPKKGYTSLLPEFGFMVEEFTAKYAHKGFILIW
jgi:hypothetical protein